MMAGLLNSVLEAEGIATVLRNDMLQGGLGEIPQPSAWPEIWVLHDADSARALDLIKAYEADAAADPWRCPQCAEHIEGQFAVCWSCGTQRGHADAPD
ncbi:MAG: DUF2007 domain-containing protein [Gammaproteobacteria bacterium]|nr:DUF2007 domain-containing protein [Gammaproteobacteria bacterium]